MKGGESSMIINHRIQAAAGVYTQATTASAKGIKKTTPAPAVQDEIVLSKEAQNFSSTLQQLKNASDTVRTDKVEYYASQLAAGTYNVESGDIAGKMLQMRY